MYNKVVEPSSYIECISTLEPFLPIDLRLKQYPELPIKLISIKKHNPVSIQDKIPNDLVVNDRNAFQFFEYKTIIDGKEQWVSLNQLLETREAKIINKDYLPCKSSTNDC